jgi:WD40 repeat protein
VVNESLGRRWDSPERPKSEEAVSIDLPYSPNPRAGVVAQVCEWFPVAEALVSDIAVLKLRSEVAVQPMRLARDPASPGQPFSTIGFPIGQDGGMDARGTLGVSIEFGRIVAHGDSLPGFFLEGGYSGAPILDSESQTVRGMAALAVRERDRRTAFVLPVQALEYAWPPLARPYQGLAAFQESDSRFFKGRERYITELAEKLEKLPLIAVVGASGSGKSSLVRAGLLPLLRSQQNWRVLMFRPGAPSTQPFENLVLALDDRPRRSPLFEALAQDNKNVKEVVSSLLDDPKSLVTLLRRLIDSDGRPVLIVVDQFEELFTAVVDPNEHDDEHSIRSKFVRCLAAAVSSRQGLPAAKCVLTIRADYMSKVLNVPDLVNLLRDADIKLGPMSPGELREAIVQPGAALDVKFDDHLVSELLTAVGSVPDALPLLEFALTELWSQQRNRRIEKRADAKSSSSGAAILQDPLIRHAEYVFAEMTRDYSERVFRTVMVGLVWIAGRDGEGNDTGRVRRRDSFSDAEWEIVEQLASQDREARLVTVRGDTVGSEPTAEIAHEVLIRQWPRLQRWLNEDRAFRLWLQGAERDADTWRRNDKGPEFLYRGGRLQEALRWERERAAEDFASVKDFVSSAETQEFVETTRREREEQERVRALAEKVEAQELARIEAERRAGQERAAAEQAQKLQADAEAARRNAEDERVRAEHERARAEGARAEAERLQAEAELERARVQLLLTEANKARNKTRKALRVAGVALGVAIFGAGVGWWWWRQATRNFAQFQTAQSQLYSTLSRESTASGDAMSGLLLALYAVAPFVFEQQPIPPQAEVPVYEALLGNRELYTLIDHIGPVEHAAFSPDGKRLVTVSKDAAAQLWDLTRERPVAMVLGGHQGAVLDAAFSPDGRRLVTVSEDKTARLWDLTGEQPVTTVLEGHEGHVLHAAFSPDGKRLVTASEDKTARLWDLTGERPVTKVLGGHGGPVQHAAFSPDGKRLVTASKDGTARLWDLSGEPPAASILDGHGDTVWHAAFSPDGKRLVTASEDKTARLWDLTGERPVAIVLGGHRAPVQHAAFSPDGKRLVTVSRERMARLWDLSGEPPAASMLDHGDVVRHAAFSADGRRLVTVSDDHTARLWDLTGERPVAIVLEAHRGPVQDAAFSPDGKWLATASHDRTARLWDLTNERPIVTMLEGHQNPVRHAAFSPDGKRLVTASEDGTARLWDVARKQPVGIVLEGHQGPVLHAAFSPDGKRLVTASRDGTTRLWDLTGELPLATVLEGHPGPALHAAFSPDGKRLVTASGDGRARLWDLTGERPVATILEGYRESVRRSAFSPDGHWLVTVSRERTAWLFDLSGDRPVATPLEGHRGPVRHAAFSPGGKRLVTASEDGTARLWDLTHGRPLATVVEAAGESLQYAEFSPRLLTESDSSDRPLAGVDSPDTKWLVTVSDGNIARLWDVTGARPVGIVLGGHRGPVRHAAFSPDGKRLVTESDDRTARLWDLTGERPVAIVLAGHRAPVQHAAFSPDGKRLVTASDETVRLYSGFDNASDLIKLACRRVTRGLTISQEESFGLPPSSDSPDRERVTPPPPLTTPSMSEKALSFNETVARLCRLLLL